MENIEKKEKKKARKSKQQRWLRSFLREKFNLSEDGATQSEVVENISKGVDFKGTNLWVLIFASFVASLGLNVNSTAVIIGAMLISPLMGPIMGMGLAVGINDFELLKRSAKNFGFMILVAVLAATLYFLISPISTAQSELLARTRPTTYDVMIAFFGGLAGIVAQTRKDRTSTVIPGVAIATALMPPLCTAGFGLATGKLDFFFGAGYLFLINTVFIAFATIVVVRFLQYEKKTFLDKQKEKRVKHYMAIVVIATIVPSIIIGFSLVKETIFLNNADRFVENVVKFDKAEIINYTPKYDRKGCNIELVLVGEAVSNDAIDNVRAQLPVYGLINTTLTFRQPTVSEKLDLTTIQQNMEQILNEKNRRILELEQEVFQYTTDTIPAYDIAREMGALSDRINHVSVSKNIIYNRQGVPQDTILISNIGVEGKGLTVEERETIGRWLKARTNSDSVKMYIEKVQ